MGDESVSERINRRLRESGIAEMLERDIARAERARVLRDPEGNRTTLHFGDNATTVRHFWAGETADGDRVWYGYSCWKNLAGYYLSFREIDYSKPRGELAGKRDTWQAHKKRSVARWRAERNARLFRGECESKTGRE